VEWVDSYLVADLLGGISSDSFSGEAAQESTFLWRDFFIGSKRKQERFTSV
jgi:hypothetical protein